MTGDPRPRVLALIPARGGSRGVTNKNVRVVGGRPLIAWTIRAARDAAGIDRVLVSTDDEAIASASRDAHAEVPFMRPAALATDDSAVVDTVVHALHALRLVDGYQPDLVMLLQPTSPLRTSADIDAAIDMQRRTRATAVVSVTAVTQHPGWMRRLDADGRLIDAAAPAPQRQGLEPLVILNGAIYLVDTAHLLAARSFYAESTMAYVMPAERSLDIDTEWDVRMADALLGSSPS